MAFHGFPKDFHRISIGFLLRFLDAMALRSPKGGHMRQEDFDALGYPQVPQHMTKEWMLEQIELEKVDPRVNPNLFPGLRDAGCGCLRGLKVKGIDIRKSAQKV